MSDQPKLKIDWIACNTRPGFHTSIKWTGRRPCTGGVRRG